ncbi:MAG TPA: hypothetical protein VGN39_18550, partial [Terriglobales bacterium]|nr:hypothetical protein [Terriglobales bacterium]
MEHAKAELVVSVKANVATVILGSSADSRSTIRDDSIGDSSRLVLRSAIRGRPFGLVRAVDSHSGDGIE